MRIGRLIRYALIYRGPSRQRHTHLDYSSSSRLGLYREFTLDKPHTLFHTGQTKSALTMNAIRVKTCSAVLNVKMKTVICTGQQDFGFFYIGMLCNIPQTLLHNPIYA